MGLIVKNIVGASFRDILLSDERLTSRITKNKLLKFISVLENATTDRDVRIKLDLNTIPCDDAKIILIITLTGYGHKDATYAYEEEDTYAVCSKSWEKINTLGYSCSIPSDQTEVINSYREFCLSDTIFYFFSKQKTRYAKNGVMDDKSTRKYLSDLTS